MRFGKMESGLTRPIFSDCDGLTGGGVVKAETIMKIATIRKRESAIWVVVWLGVMALMGAPVYAVTIADSLADFSGTQGTKNWLYGRGFPYSETNPTLSNFVQLAYYFGGVWHPNSGTNAPTLTSGGGHPGYEAAVYGEWAVRRYTSPYSGYVHLSGSCQHNQEGPGDGTAARMVVDGRVVYVMLTPSNGVTAGPIFNYDLTLRLYVGSTIFMSIDNRANSDNDYTNFKLKIDSLPTRGVIADSYLNFTAAQQSPDSSGLGHWQYGQISNNVFSTSGWGYYPDWGAWTNSGFRILSSSQHHPYTTNSLLVSRRWTSGVARRIIIEGWIRKGDEANPGDGVIASILKNGVNIYTGTLSGMTNWYGMGNVIDVGTRTFALTNTVAVGDTLDLTLDPRGDNNNDSTDFCVTITTEAEGSVFAIR